VTLGDLGEECLGQAAEPDQPVRHRIVSLAVKDYHCPFGQKVYCVYSKTTRTNEELAHAFTDDEVAYLTSQPLARIATASGRSA